MTSTIRTAAALVALAAPAAAQLQTVATESFDYAVPGLLDNLGTGTGFADTWDVGPNGNEIVPFDTSINPPFALADSIGGYAGQASGFGSAFRTIDLNPHGDIVDGIGIGADGSTVWISFSTVAFQVFGPNYGGLSLWNLVDDEQLFIGSPFGTGQWGVDDLSPSGAGVSTVSGSDIQAAARIVVRIDHMVGDERVRMWVSPSSPNPTTPADVDVMVPDFRWSQIRLSSGGSGSAYFWDEIVVQKGDSSFGTPFCTGAVNSTGASGVMSLSGSPVKSANNVTLEASNVPPGEFGIFVTSRTIGAPGLLGQGFLCLSGAFGRYQGPGLIQQADAAGNFALAIDLNAMPQPNGTIAANAGETWHFQAWYRDSLPGIGATSNFTRGISVTLQ